MDDNLKKVPKNLQKRLKKQTYLNLNHIQISSKEKLAQLRLIFNNMSVIKFLIIYMRDNIIVGENVINISYPIYKHYLDINIEAKRKSERCINKIANQMKLLKANSYYLIHISNIEKNIALKEEINTTRFFASNLDGFMGHLIVNSNSYYWIDVKDNEFIISKKRYIKNINNLKYERSIKKGIYWGKIRNRKDIIKYIYCRQINKNNSLIVITNQDNMIQIIFEIPNQLFIKQKKNMQKYLDIYNKNDLRVFCITKDKKIFCEVKRYIFNSVIYKEINGELYINKE